MLSSGWGASELGVSIFLIRMGSQSERQSFRQPHDTISYESKQVTYIFGRDGVKTYAFTIMTGRITIHQL